MSSGKLDEDGTFVVCWGCENENILEQDRGRSGGDSEKSEQSEQLDEKERRGDQWSVRKRVR